MTPLCAILPLVLLVAMGDAVLASNRYDRDEVRGGWGHDASESEMLMAV